MNITINTKNKIIAIIFVFIYVAGTLIWEHFNGGVVSHHLFANESLPKFSNWWGILTIPVLSCILLSIIQRKHKINDNEKSSVTKSEFYLFIGAFLFAIILTISFYNELGIHSYLLLSTFILALFIPLYKPEYFLGFILGLTFGFGGILPILFGIILMLIYTIEYCLIRKGILLIFKSLKKGNTSKTA